jgi:signal transduction histidine kinase
LRDLAHGIYPPALESDGLRGALNEAARRAAAPVAVASEHVGRYRPELEAAVYFCCLEALQNAAKHAGERAQVRVWVREEGGELRFEVADDGAGFDAVAAAASYGLQNMRDRIGALGGELRVESSPRAGTVVAGRISA